MQSAKKKILIVSAFLLILAVLVFLCIYHLPEKIETTVRVMPETASKELAEQEMEITLRLTRWKLLFSEDQLKGSIVIDGVEYVKNDGWRTPNYFYTTPYPGDGTAHIVIPQEVLDWRQNYVLLVLEGKTATLSYSNLPAEKIATYVFSVEDSI